MIIRALDIARDWPDIRRTLEIPLTEDTGGMVLAHQGRILAASIFDHWTHTSVQMHMLARNYRAVVQHKFAEEVFDYIFTTANRKKMLGLIPSDNRPSLRLAKRFGFREKARIENGFDENIDLVFIELNRESCPYWAGVKHEPIRTEAA